MDNMNQSPTKSISKTKPENKFEEVEYSKNLREMLYCNYLNQKNVDTYIVMANGSFKAHSIVLSKTNNVFKNLLANFNTPSQEKIINLPEFSVEVMRYVIEYLYRGSTFYYRELKHDIEIAKLFFQISTDDTPSSPKESIPEEKQFSTDETPSSHRESIPEETEIKTTHESGEVEEVRDVIKVMYSSSSLVHSHEETVESTYENVPELEMHHVRPCDDVWTTSVYGAENLWTSETRILTDEEWHDLSKDIEEENASSSSETKIKKDPLSNKEIHYIRQKSDENKDGKKKKYVVSRLISSN